MKPWIAVRACLFAGAVAVTVNASATESVARIGAEFGPHAGSAGSGFRLVNEDAAAHKLELRCSGQLWESTVKGHETAWVAPPSSAGCTLHLAGTSASVPLVGDYGELVIAKAALHVRVRTLEWTQVERVYGGSDTWPDGMVRQWAAKATASTEYASDAWSAMRATGAPDTAQCGDSQSAWAPQAVARAEPEWIELHYPTKVRAVGARLRVTFTPGAVREVLARTGAGWEPVWKGADPTASCPATLVIRFSEEVDTDAIRVVLDTSQQTNWFELDAVELVGAPLAVR